MDITLVGILLASVGILTVLVYLMCRDAMSESWLSFSTQSRQQMRSDENRKGGLKEELRSLTDKIFAQMQKKKTGAHGSKEAGAKEAAGSKKTLLSNNYVRIFLASLAVYLLFFGYFFITAKPPSFETSVSEEPLVKIAQLSLEEGVYAYSMKSNNTNVQVKYAVTNAPSCVGYLIIGEDKSQLCIGKNGNAVGEKPQSNMSAVQAGAFYLFSPWMLAVQEGWQWGITLNVLEKNLGMNYTSRLEYAFVSREKVLGRDAYKVSIAMQGQHAGFAFVDAEKRILLLQNSSLGEISLTNAPFLSK